MPAYYACKVCGEDHPTEPAGLRFASRDAFERAGELAGVSCRLPCPARASPPELWACALYLKQELFWRDG